MCLRLICTRTVHEKSGVQHHASPNVHPHPVSLDQRRAGRGLRSKLALATPHHPVSINLVFFLTFVLTEMLQGNVNEESSGFASDVKNRDY